MNKDSHQQLLGFIEQKLDRGKREAWVNGDFETLSALVRRETKVYISTATLKRIFGKVQVSEGYTPHRSTIDALKQFVDYDQRLSAEETQRQRRHRQVRKLGILLASVVVAAIGVGVWWQMVPPTEGDHRVRLEVQRVEGRCPATAFFHLTMDEAERASLWFGDDSPPLGVPAKDDRDHTHFYAYPGYFQPELRRHKTVIARSEPILVETEGWQAFAHRYVENPYPKEVIRYYPLQLSANIDKGIFHASKGNLAKMGLDTTQILVVRLDQYARFGVSADEFTYESRVRNEEFWPGVRCYSIILRIQGTKGKIEVKLVAEGCSGYSQVVLGDSSIMKRMELLPLALDVSAWNQLEITNIKQAVTLKANGTILFEGSYPRSLGELVGTSVIFHGSGEVDYVRLASQGEDVLESPF